MRDPTIATASDEHQTTTAPPPMASDGLRCDVSAIGGLRRWDPKTCTLELIGFHDPRVYVISLSVIKNRFVLVGDAYGSVQV